MEGAEKKEISLVSGIDIGSSDSFVSLEQPLFTHNRQKYQGGTLPSSVRFEHDGFACGWDVYQFTLTEDHIPLSPADIYATRKRMFSSGVYRFKFYNTSDVEKGTLYFIRKTIVKDYKVITNVTTEQNTNGFVCTGNYTDILNKYHDIQITGTWSEDFTALSWQVLIDGSTASGITITHDHDGYISDITVQDTDNTLNLNITDLCLTSDVFSGEDIIATFQQYTNNMYTWLGNMIDITYNGSIAATPHNDDISDISFSDLSFDEVDHNILSATMSLKYSLDYVLSASADIYIPYIDNVVSDKTTGLIKSDAYDSDITISDTSPSDYATNYFCNDYDNFNYIRSVIYYDSDNYKRNLRYIDNTVEGVTSKDIGGINVKLKVPEWKSIEIVPLTSRCFGYTNDATTRQSDNYPVKSGGVSGYAYDRQYKLPVVPNGAKSIDSKIILKDKCTFDISDIVTMYNIPCRSDFYIGVYNNNDPIITDFYFYVYNSTRGGIGQSSVTSAMHNSTGYFNINPYSNSTFEGDIFGGNIDTSHTETWRYFLCYATFDIVMHNINNNENENITVRINLANMWCNQYDNGGSDIQLIDCLIDNLTSRYSSDNKYYIVSVEKRLVTEFNNESTSDPNYYDYGRFPVSASRGDGQVGQEPIPNTSIAIVPCITSEFSSDVTVPASMQLIQNKTYTVITQQAVSLFLVSPNYIVGDATMTITHFFLGGNLLDSNNVVNKNYYCDHDWLNTGATYDAVNYLAIDKSNGYTILKQNAADIKDGNSRKTSGPGAFIYWCAFNEQEVTITPNTYMSDSNMPSDFSVTSNDDNAPLFYINSVSYDSSSKIYTLTLSFVNLSTGYYYYKMDYNKLNLNTSASNTTIDISEILPGFLLTGDTSEDTDTSLKFFIPNNMTSEGIININLQGIPCVLEPITGFNISYDNINNYSNHEFFTTDEFSSLQQANITVSDPVYTYTDKMTATQNILIQYGEQYTVTIRYTMSNGYNNVSISDILSFIFSSDNFVYTVEDTFSINNMVSIVELFTYMSLRFIKPLSYSLQMSLLYTEDTDYTIKSYSDNKVYFKVGAYTILLNLSTGTVSCEDINYSTTLESILRITEYHGSTYYDVISDINVSLLLTMLIDMYIRGVYSTENVLLTSDTSLSDDGQLVITFDGTDYTLSIADMFSDEFNNYINEYVIDTRDSSLSSKLIEKIDTNDAYTFVRQAWNTSTEIRSYWVIDPLTYVSLDDYNFYVYKKAEGLDPWYGDKWELKHTIPKTDIINSETVWYGATSCNNVEHAYFLTVTYIDDNTFRVTVYNGNDMSLLYYSSIDINYVKLGTKLNRSNKVINTYSSISVRMLLSKSYISATAIDDKIIMGLHYDCNFNQWALIFDIGQQSLDKIIQGYGYVGYNGDLTGGEIPNDFFDVSYGFDDIVYDYNTKLNTTPKDIDNINDLNASMSYVVGTESRQWYIKNSIKYIVSHLAYKDEEYTPVLLPLSNNYTAGYASPSFSTIVFSDTLLNAKSMKSLFPLKGNYASAWKAALYTFGYPLIYYVAPKLTSMVYLQQTVGQSAYVHYNSASERHKNTADNSVNYAEDKSVASVMHDYMQNGDAITFDTKYIKQSLSCDDTSYNDMFALLSTLGISALDYVVNNTHVTEGDKFKMSFGHGDLYSAYAAKNFESEALTDLRMESTTPSEVSEVTVSKSLDMFYSTSDTQNVCAGPGYVNHNFVAQCINQSTTSLQLQMTQQQLMFILTALTRYQLEIEYLAAKKTADFLKRTADNFSGPAGGGIGVVFLNTVAAVAASIGWLVAVAYEHTLKIAVDNVPDLIRAMGGDSLKSTVTARMTKHKYDIEPKHRYGSKQEMFMYPSRAKGVSIIDESVAASYVNKTWEINKPTSKNLIANSFSMVYHNAKFVTDSSTKGGVAKTFDGDVPYYIYKIKGNKSEKTLPSGIAYIAGVQSFLPTDPYKNDTVRESAPVFSTPIIYDYLISEQWDIFATASGDNGIAWVSCKGTKLIDGAPTNIFISDESAIIASPYTVIEILDGCDKDYLRPTLVTPSALALNISKYNVLYEKKAYNAFDGTSSRILNWAGAPAMAVNKRTWLYSFIANDRFKRSNKLPALEVLGNFKVLPTIDSITADKDDRFILHMIHPEDTGFKLDPNIIGEDLDTRRYSIPIFSEVLSTLPSQVKTIESYVLAVYDGITSLCSDIRNTQSRYKVPMSVDFNINGQMFRFTNEYICSVITSNGAVVLQQLVPTEGLTFLGATPYNAYLYSQSNRLYYIYSGGTTLQAVDMIERFRNVKLGMYDFIEQSVAMECLTDMSRIDSTIDDDSDETDNVFIANLKNGGFDSEVSPPATTLFDEDSWFKVYSLPSGIVFQGPNRCHIHRQIFSKYMTEQVKNNLGKWGRVPREYFHPFRDYGYKYTAVNEPVSESDNKDKAVAGWTHNPFVLVTAMLGADLSVDCNFEWEIIFTWTDEMDAIYTNGQYACVNVMAETITEGGKVACRPSHIFLTKELFSRNGDQGYYTFRYASNNGIGNRERLFLWSDAYIAINSLSVEFKPISQRRASVLTQQIDIQNMKEL